MNVDANFGRQFAFQAVCDVFRNTQVEQLWLLRDQGHIVTVMVNVDALDRHIVNKNLRDNGKSVLIGEMQQLCTEDLA